MHNNTYDFKTVSGIDTLYFFYVTTPRYELLFQDILMQIDMQELHFKQSGIRYENKDIYIKVDKTTLQYLSKAQGFYWFMDTNALFKIGFKDPMTNTNLNDIQVQYMANGIYTIGIEGLLRFTDDLLKEYITGERPITRADLNIFVQRDLSMIKKEMFVTRKRLFISHYKEIETKHQLESLYIGKKPFLLREYDKRAELLKSKKQALMKEYFANHDIDIKQPLFNIEFEFHRDYLKGFGIDTVDRLLERAELLFKDSMDAIRMIDTKSITDNTTDGNNRNRASTHPMWEYIKDAYTLKEFLQLDLSLERVKRKTYLYTFEDAITDHMILARKCLTHQIPISLDFYQEVLDQIAYAKKPINDFTLYKRSMDDKPQHPDVATLSNFELKTYVRSLEHDMNDKDKDLTLTMRHLGLALDELDRRGFPKAFPF